MRDLYIIFGLSMIIDTFIVYLSLGIILAEHKGIYLPLIKKIRKEQNHGIRKNKRDTEDSCV